MSNWRKQAALAAVLPSILLSILSAQETPGLRTRYENARRFLGEEDYTEACESLRALLAEEPDFVPAYLSLVEAYSELEDLEGARVYFEDLLKREPNNAYLHYGLALVDGEMEYDDTAMEHLERAITLEPTLADAYGMRGGWRRSPRGRRSSMRPFNSSRANLLPIPKTPPPSMERRRST